MDIKKLVVGMVETNCYIVSDGGTKQAVVIDPGDEAERIEAQCRSMGLAVRAILLTHGHFDHVTAVEELKKKWNVPVYAYEKEAAVLADETLNLSNQFRGSLVNLKADVLCRDQEIIEAGGFRFRVIGTPGHTVGSCCYYAEEEKVLFSGDTLFAGSYGRVDFPTGSSSDMVHSVAEVLFDLPDDVAVYPGHMEETTIGYEKKYNPLAGYRGKGL